MNPMMRLRLANAQRGSFRAEGDTIWLYDMIASDDDEAEWMGGASPLMVIAALRGAAGPVTLRLNSPGGSVFGAQAIVQAMREHPHPITVRVDGVAASAASWIATAGAETVMGDGAVMMIHCAAGMAFGNANEMLEMAQFLEKIDGVIAGHYAARSGQPADGFLQQMQAETWFTAAEAVQAGLADRVDDSTQRPRAVWDLAAYAKAPALPEPDAAAATEASNAAEARRRHLDLALRGI